MEAAAGDSRHQAARGRSLGLLAVVVLLDLAFLHEIWNPLGKLGHLGIWDWDYQMSLVEAARKTLLEHRQLPLWNPWMGGGSTLVGHPLARTFDPLFLPPLLFGTVLGLKLCMLLYLLIGQAGMYRLARTHGAGAAAAVFAALVFSWSASWAQHLTHGHVEWLAYAWVPWLLLAFDRACAAPRGAASVRATALAAVFLALAWLDGGPYQYAFVPLTLGAYAGLRVVEGRDARPFALLAGTVALAAALSAVQLAPVFATVLEIPRDTRPTTDYYAGPLDPGLWDVVREAFFSRSQAHDPDFYMPFRVNVGAYVGVVPVLLAGLALGTRWRRLWPLGAMLALSVWVFLSDHLPLGPWPALHALPGFDGLRVPARFNFFVVLWLSLLAGLGLERCLGLSGIAPRLRRGLAAFVVAAVAFDLFRVCAPIFAHAFVLPPFEATAPGPFRQHENSPLRGLYAERAGRPVWNDHWPNETFPVLKANEGTIRGYAGLQFVRRAVAHDDPSYPGAEAWLRGRGRVLDVQVTPTRLTVEVEGEGGRVLVNQNHMRGWRVASGPAPRVAPFDGLISFRVPSGHHTVVLAYRPTAFYAGAAVSLLAWGLVLARLLRPPRRGQ